MTREVFVAGQILTAAEMNAVSDQTVMSFAGTAARGSAIPSPVEGMVTYLEDADRWEGYTTTWRPLSGLVAVKSAIFKGTQSASVTAGGNVAVTDLSITHAVSDPANKLIISAFLGVAAESGQFGRVGLAIHDGTGLIEIGNADGSRTRVSAGGHVSDGAASYVVTMPSVTFVHTPGSGSKTYTVRAVRIAGDTGSVWINRNEGDGDTSTSPRGVSSLVIQEVAV